ncbi:MAG: hypothetical protein WCJ58_02900 [bacterium]
MKIFILGTRTPDLINTYSAIGKYLKDKGHIVYDEWLNTTDKDDADNFELAFQRNTAFIKQSDIIITEVSKASSGVSFLMASALNLKKPVLALYDKAHYKNPPSTIRGSSKRNKLLTYNEYTKENLLTILDKYLKQIKNILDTKFILIISPEIDRYLEWVGENRRMHKAQVVRNAVEEMIRKDKEYKDFLKIA